MAITSLSVPTGIGSYPGIDRYMTDIELEKFHSFYRVFIDFINLDFESNVKISRYTLIDIIVRVHKRICYYAYFHDIELNERKVAGLYAYWVLRLRPIYVTNESIADEQRGCTLNEEFAIFIICALLFYSKRLKSYNKVTKMPFYQTLLYAFRFRNISIDSMMLFVESINENTFKRQNIEVV